MTAEYDLAFGERWPSRSLIAISCGLCHAVVSQDDRGAHADYHARQVEQAARASVPHAWENASERVQEQWRAWARETLFGVADMAR